MTKIVYKEAHKTFQLLKVYKSRTFSEGCRKGNPDLLFFFICCCVHFVFEYHLTLIIIIPFLEKFILSSRGLIIGWEYYPQYPVFSRGKP